MFDTQLPSLPKSQTWTKGHISLLFAGETAKGVFVAQLKAVLHPHPHALGLTSMRLVLVVLESETGEEDLNRDW